MTIIWLGIIGCLVVIRLSPIGERTIKQRLTCGLDGDPTNAPWQDFTKELPGRIATLLLIGFIAALCLHLRHH